MLGGDYRTEAASEVVLALSVMQHSIASALLVIVKWCASLKVPCVNTFPPRSQFVWRGFAAALPSSSSKCWKESRDPDQALPHGTRTALIHLSARESYQPLPVKSPESPSPKGCPTLAQCTTQFRRGEGHGLLHSEEAGSHDVCSR